MHADCTGVIAENPIFVMADAVVADRGGVRDDQDRDIVEKGTRGSPRQTFSISLSVTPGFSNSFVTCVLFAVSRVLLSLCCLLFFALLHRGRLRLFVYCAFVIDVKFPKDIYFFTF